MDERDWLTSTFEENRPHLRAVAYRMLGSGAEADDAVQEAWIRLRRADTGDVQNLGGWLTTVVARVCLNMLRARRTRREDPLVGDEAASGPAGNGGNGVGAGDRDSVGLRAAAPFDPEQEALLADAVGPALLVVLDTLAPPERLAFVLHDMFAVPFDEIAAIVGRSPAAARQLASRARRRVHGVPAVPDPDIARQRRVVDAFLAASRLGSFDALLAVLDPDVTLRADRVAMGGSDPRFVQGAEAVASGALTFSSRSRFSHPILVDGSVGVVIAPNGRLLGVARLVIGGDLISGIEIIADPATLDALDLAVLDD